MIDHIKGMAPPIVDGIALFLDLDGTLAPIAATPDAIVLDFRVPDLLRRLNRRLNGRVAIVSGRSLENIDDILDGNIVAVAGLHGLERRGLSGVRMSVAAHPGLVQAREEFLRLAEIQPGLLVEDKGLGVTLHYRGAPEFAKTAGEVGRRLAASAGLAFQEGNRVVELLTPGQDKGSAVLTFMTEAPFAGAMPVFIGDDLADEHAFAAVSGYGGFGILVGPERETAARYRLSDVDAVIAWLQLLVTEPTA